MSEPLTDYGQRFFVYVLESTCHVLGTMKEKLLIEDCRKQAEDLLMTAKLYQEVTVNFYLCGECGRVKARWLDPHMGMIQTEGSTGFMMSRDLPSYLWCEDLAMDGEVREEVKDANSSGLS